MLDAADLAILETYCDAMNPVERGLVEEIRRLMDDAEAREGLKAKIEELEEELDAVKDELSDAKEENDKLLKIVACAEAEEREAYRLRDLAQDALGALKSAIREVAA